MPRPTNDRPLRAYRNLRDATGRCHDTATSLGARKTCWPVAGSGSALAGAGGTRCVTGRPDQAMKHFVRPTKRFHPSGAQDKQLIQTLFSTAGRCVMTITVTRLLLRSREGCRSVPARQLRPGSSSAHRGRPAMDHQKKRGPAQCVASGPPATALAPLRSRTVS